jgi:predicted CXXCH cytochrome family protein
MPMNRETGKDRWRRIPKEYFKKRDRLQSAKLQLSALAFVLVIAWWVLGIDWKGQSESSTDLNGLRANHGELASVHNAWANQCNACHVPFEPIDGRGLFASSSSVENRSSDKLCMTCHAGPAHHSTTIAAEVKGCAQCHRDHQGANFSLVRMKDGECTSCHESLTAHIAAGAKPGDQRQYGNVVKFDDNPKDHPVFRPEAALFDGDKPPLDKSKLKFSHARHLMPGIVKKVGDTPYKIEDIRLESERARYQKSADLKEAVQLDCASCHVLDSTEVRGGTNPAVASVALPLRNSGKYYLPATFESSCRACHTLTVVGGGKPLEVPHGVQTDQVIDFLQIAYAAQILSDYPKVLDSYVPGTKIPGKSPVESTVRKKRDDAVKAALKSLFAEEIKPAPGGASSSNANNCVECHYYGPLDRQGFPTKVEPTRVPQVWFTHAAFDHTAHRGVSCRDCHAKAYAFEPDGKTPVKEASWSATDYLNPGIDNCVQCHAPTKKGGGLLGMGSPATRSGGASFDCTECHRYHNRDNLLQGIGASAEDASTIRSISQFLSGSAGEPAKPEPSKSGKP